MASPILPDTIAGIGEAMLELTRKHSTLQQWESYLEVALHGAAAQGDLTMVTRLLKAGAASLGRRKQDGQTPLHAAAEGGSLGVVAALLNEQARQDLNKRTRFTKRTPLYCAVMHGHEDIFLALVGSGANVNLTDSNGWTPLMRATADGRARLVTTLLQHGALVNEKNKDHSQALDIAIVKGHLDITKVLLRAGALTCYRRKWDGKSPLHLAVQRADTSTMRELLAAGACPNSLIEDGLTALHTAVPKGRVEMIDILIDAGAKQNSKNDDGSTPLHLACALLKADVVKTLLRRDADEFAVNKKGESPADVTGVGWGDSTRDEYSVECIHELLARAPAERAWCHRGWLAMLNARHKMALEANTSIPSTEQNCCNKEGPPISKRKYSGEYDPSLGQYSNFIHPSLRRFHLSVTGLLNVTDDLVFKRVVSFL